MGSRGGKRGGSRGQGNSPGRTATRPTTMMRLRSSGSLSEFDFQEKGATTRASTRGSKVATSSKAISDASNMLPKSSTKGIHNKTVIPKLHDHPYSVEKPINNPSAKANTVHLNSLTKSDKQININNERKNRVVEEATCVYKADIEKKNLPTANLTEEMHVNSSVIFNNQLNMEKGLADNTSCESKTEKKKDNFSKESKNETSVNNSTAVVAESNADQNVSDNLTLDNSSALKMDENFDINEFIGVTNEETLTSIANKDPVKTTNAVKDLSDDDFLKQFPEINVIQDTIANKPKRKGYSKIKGPRTIAEYSTEMPNNLIEEANATPSTSNCAFSSSKVAESSNSNAPTLKRRLNDIQVFDENAENINPKKSKIDQPSKEKNVLPATIVHKNIPKLGSTSKSPLASRAFVTYDRFSDDCEDDSDSDNLSMSDFDEPNCDMDDYGNYSDSDDSDMHDEFNETCSDMPFPNLGEGINFDVSAIPKRPGMNFPVSNLGDKGLQEYLRERSLTAECIEQLYHSLINIPKDGVERDPRGLTVPLMAHQRHGLKWMRWREDQKPSGGILADDMGLGKTLQVISLVLAAKNEKKEKEMANGNFEDSIDELDEDWGLENPHKVYKGNTLVICPPSLLRQWEREVDSKCQRGCLNVYIYHGTTRIISERKLSKFDLVITTYNLIVQEHELQALPKKNKDSRIFKIEWQRVILDEAHYVRNYLSKMSKAACELTVKSRWALTATPIQNKESDLYALLKFLKCSPFDELPVWNRWVSNRNSVGNKRLIIITKSLMFRRTKEELMLKGAIEALPDKLFEIVEVKLDPEEKVVYQKLLLYSQTFFVEFLRQRRNRQHMKQFGCHARPSLLRQEIGSWTEMPDKLSKLLKVLMRHHTQVGSHFILVLILRLRQICCHPALIKAMLDQEAEAQEDVKDPHALAVNDEIIKELDELMTDDEDEDGSFCLDEKQAQKVMSSTNPVFKKDRKSSKVRAILKVIQGVLDKGEKVVVVSQWTGFLKVIADNLDLMQDAKYNMFTGKVNVKDRQRIIDRLNDVDDTLNILLLSLTAGGVGLNLVGANNLLLIDLHWNPQLETQAQDRIYRFGQENNVHIYKFICKDTIEEKIKKLQDRKLEIAKKVLTGTVSSKLTIEDLKLIFS